MEQHFVVQFFIDHFWKILMGIGFALVYVAVLATEMRNLKHSMNDIKEILKELSHSGKKVDARFVHVDERFAHIDERLARIETLVTSETKDMFAPSHSPRQLNDEGARLIADSKVNDSFMTIKDFFVETVKKECESLEPYDVERCVEEIALSVPKTHPELYQEIKRNTYNTGKSAMIILLVGSIAMRDVVLEELGINFSKNS